MQQKFEQSYNQYAPDILRYVFFRVGDMEKAQDLTQETFFKAWKSIAEGGAEIKNFRAFFYKIANNSIIDHYRKKKEVALPEREEIEVLLSVEANQVQLMDAQIEKEELHRYLLELKESYRVVLMMHYIEGLSIEEIAEATDKSRGNVRILLFRALQSLRKKYEK